MEINDNLDLGKFLANVSNKFRKKQVTRFIVNTNGTVFDNTTNLTWQREVPNETFNWKEAKQYAANLGDGWRLPTREELLSIEDRSGWNPAIDAAAFPNTPSEWFWSSLPVAGSSDVAWAVNFYSGHSGYSGIANSLRVRCVR